MKRRSFLQAGLFVAGPGIASHAFAGEQTQFRLLDNDVMEHPSKRSAAATNTVIYNTSGFDHQAVPYGIDHENSFWPIRNELLPHLEAPPIIKPLGAQWPVFAFRGGAAERAKAPTVADFRQVFENALSTGERIVGPRHRYVIRSSSETKRVIKFTGDVPIDMQWEGGAEIVPGAELSSLTAGFFSLAAKSTPSNASKIPFRWSGGIFDTSELKSAPGYGLTLLDIFQYTNPIITGGIWKCQPSEPHGSDMGFGKCDTAVTMHNCFGGTVAYNDFGAFYDACVYISGKNGGERLGDYGLFVNVLFNTMRRAQNAVVFKRDFVGIRIMANDVYQCGNGFLASATDHNPSNHGRRVIIADNRIIETQGRPIYVVGGKKNIITNNDISDWGKWFSDKATFTNVATGNRCAAIDLRGARLSQVTNNIIDQDLYAGGVGAPDKEPVGIQVRDSEEGVGSTDNDIVGNRIYHAHRPILEFGASTNRNRFQDNPIAPMNGTNFHHLIQGANSQFIGVLLEGGVKVDSASIPAGASSSVIDISVPGAAIGDWIESWALSQEGETSSFHDLTVKWFITTNNVQIVLSNNTNASIDIRSAIFKVRVRKA